MNQGLEPAETYGKTHSWEVGEKAFFFHISEWSFIQDQIFMWNVQQYKRVLQLPEKISSQSQKAELQHNI